MNIHQIHSHGITWINAGSPGIEELAHIEKIFVANPQDIKDTLPPVQRPKLVERNDYLFLIFQFPVYNKQNRRIEPEEVDFFLSAKSLAMVHNSKLDVLRELFDNASHDTRISNELIGSTSALLVSILETIFAGLNPMLNHISLDIDSVEERLLDGHNRQVIKEILIVKRNIVNFRKIMQAHKSVIEGLANRGGFWVNEPIKKQRLSELIHTTIEIWDSLKNYEDAINAIHESHASLVNVRQSEIIKTLTIISVLTFPLTLIAAVFAIDPQGGMPFVHHPQGFWIIMSFLFFVGLFMLLIFKKKKWI